MITFSEPIKNICNTYNFFEKSLLSITNESNCQILWKNEIIKDKEMQTLRVAPGLISSYFYADTPLSLIYSTDGSYYDCKNSNIDKLLNSDWIPAEDDYNIACLAIQLINKYRITKHNEYPHVPSSLFDTKGILLIDQIIDEDSVLYGDSNETTFSDMFFHVFDNDMYNKIYIKLHPDTINKKNEGYLYNLLKRNNLLDHPAIVVISENYNMASIFDYVDDIFTVTSQVGFEALLRGKNVTCFGTPFYSGYGLTTDIQQTNRSERSLLDLFIAVAIESSIYLNPFTLEKGNILDVLEYISLQQRHSNSLDVLLFKSKLSKKDLTYFLQTENIKKISNVNNKNEFGNNSLLLTDSKNNFNLIKDKKNHGFITSGFIFNVDEEPSSLILDYNGAYFDPSDYSDIEYTLNQEKFTDYEYILADNFIESLKTRYMINAKKQNTGNVFSLKKNNGNKNIIFVLGQDEKSDLIKFGSPIKSNYQFMLEVCKNVKKSIIIYKPFLTSKKNNDKDNESIRMLERIARENDNRLIIEKDSHISHCIDAADEIHTINSIIGIEALIKNKKVVTYGFPFYGGWGLTEDKQSYPRNHKKISLKDLIIGAYLYYPMYVIPNRFGFMNAFTAINYIPEQPYLKYLNFDKINFKNISFTIDIIPQKIKEIKVNDIISLFRKIKSYF